MLNPQVTVISGETGCGKTTQVTNRTSPMHCSCYCWVLLAVVYALLCSQCPQFLLDDAIQNGWGDYFRCLCTQPRRISAVGVATRVAQERCSPLGGIVGYQIRLERKLTPETR